MRRSVQPPVRATAHRSQPPDRWERWNPITAAAAVLWLALGIALQWNFRQFGCEGRAPATSTGWLIAIYALVSIGVIAAAFRRESWGPGFPTWWSVRKPILTIGGIGLFMAVVSVIKYFLTGGYNC